MSAYADNNVCLEWCSERQQARKPMRVQMNLTPAVDQNAWLTGQMRMYIITIREIFEKLIARFNIVICCLSRATAGYIRSLNPLQVPSKNITIFY